jgi:hypothetical protein
MAVTFKPDRDGCWRNFIWCFQCNADLDTLANLTGAPSAAALLEDPLAYLTGFGQPHTNGPAPPLPSNEQAIRWGVKLRSGSPGLTWLRTSKRLSLGALRDARVGWDPARQLIVLPYFLGGNIVAFKTCQVGDKLHKPGRSGEWTWPLYPEPQRAFGWTWLVEGEWDALRLRSIGLPAVSVHNGKGTRIDPSHGEQLRGLYVRVMFDVGAEPEARKAVKRLRRAGINARHHPARLLGLTEKNEDVSDYLDQGGDPKQLRHRGRSTT